MPCATVDATTGLPSDWGGFTRYDEASTSAEDESTLGACCDADGNSYYLRVYHFSTYAPADPS